MNFSSRRARRGLHAPGSPRFASTFFILPFLVTTAGIAQAGNVLICHRAPNTAPQILSVTQSSAAQHLKNHPDNLYETEKCDGIDNDCDGFVDEELGFTACGVGPCRHRTANCVGGVPQTCDPLQGATAETCDGIDNDCDGTIDDRATGGITVQVAPGDSPGGGYIPLSLFGTPPIAGVGDDTITNLNVPQYLFGGQTYTRVGVSSNGYVIIGGSSSSSDNSINNQNFPNPVRPNNVLAPFWTDLNPAASTGSVRITTLTDGTKTWIVVDWDTIREFSQPKNASFEIWIGIASNGNEDISFAFGTIEGNGDGGFLSVGAENICGSSGQNTYFNGTGTLPSSGTELRVTATP